MIADLMALANAVLAGIAAFCGVLLIRRDPRRNQRWHQIALVILCLYWCGIYTYVVIVNFIPGLTRPDPYFFGEVFIRPAFTLTLGITAAGMIARLKKIPA